MKLLISCKCLLINLVNACGSLVLAKVLLGLGFCFVLFFAYELICLAVTFKT